MRGEKLFFPADNQQQGDKQQGVRHQQAAER
jgi:hypothetical protein